MFRGEKMDITRLYKWATNKMTIVLNEITKLKDTTKNRIWAWLVGVEPVEMEESSEAGNVGKNEHHKKSTLKRSIQT
uniref:Uncharacterized protein n=1 Tax=Kalanchoe fedtschenkoi TaxID=63787 RepID=A0A7N0TD04_KALFE